MPERNCVTCDAARKRVWGCDGNAEIPVYIGGEQHFTCPRRPLLDHPEEFNYWLRLYKYYRKGFLPEPGSMLEQAAITLQVMDIFDAVYAEVEEFRSEQAKKGNPSDGQRKGAGVLSSRG